MNIINFSELNDRLDYINFSKPVKIVIDGKNVGNKISYNKGFKLASKYDGKPVNFIDVKTLKGKGTGIGAGIGGLLAAGVSPAIIEKVKDQAVKKGYRKGTKEYDDYVNKWSRILVGGTTAAGAILGGIAGRGIGGALKVSTGYQKV